MKNRKGIAYVALSVILAAACAACSAPRRPTATRTPVPQVETRPTVTPTRAPVVQATPASAPTLSQLAAVNQLETQVEGVYHDIEASVVNVTSQSIGYSFRMQAVPETGTGSGFVYDTAGHIVTNYHVVQQADSVSVALSEGTSYTATVVGQDPSTDLAVLKIDAPNMPPPLQLADSSQLRVGQFVLAIGSPFALQRTLTLGIISALQRVIQSPDGSFIGQAIQTDAAINPGNSGGPLLDLTGQVIGVNSQIIGATGANVGIGFAIASNTVAQVVPELIAHGRYPHPWLGLNAIDITSQGAQILRDAGMNVPVDEGLLVTDVTAGGPAAVAGIQGATQTVRIGRSRLGIGGDFITALDGQAITSNQDLSLYLDAHTKVGDAVSVTFYRDGKQNTVAVKLGDLSQ